MGGLIAGEKDGDIIVDLPAKFSTILECPEYDHYAYFGGRGTGKTHHIGEALVIEAFSWPARIVCGRQFQASIDESVKELLENKIEYFGLSWFFKITEYEIVGQNGSSFSFVGLDRNPGSIKSFEGADITFVEEANYVKAKALEILIPTVLRKPGSRMIWAWNPDQKTDPVDDLFRGKKPPSNSYVCRVTHDDNPHFATTKLPQQMEDQRQRDEQKYRHIWLGEYNTLSDVKVFTNWRTGRIDVPETCEPLFGMDFGFSQDPNAVVKLYVIEGIKTIYISNEAFGKKIPSKELPALLDTIPQSRDFYIAADSSRPETIDGLRVQGFNIAGAKKGPNSVKDGLSWLQGYDIVISPDCPNMIAEAQNYEWKTDPLGKPLPVPCDKENHGWDAVRYATEQKRIGGGSGGVRKIRF